ncbi:MAG: DUF3604 domain-containing protein, partial [Myxococcota bacterium]
GGCVHRRDFVRNVLKEGLAEEQRLGLNPYAFGFIGSTDTHNGTPGYVDDRDFQGHVGLVDDDAEKRLGPGTITHDSLINNPGGLAAVWAEENTREAIFSAILRRETFATSGPRIRIRLFGGWDDLPEDLCSRDDRLEVAYREGVPMGGVLPPRAAEPAPRFFVNAEWDEGTEQSPGTRLERLQIIKGWLDGEGVLRERVVDVVTFEGETPTVDDETCQTNGAGETSLCSVWTDPDFDPDASAFYYARVIEGPSCRWSQRQCLALADPKPEGCTNGRVPTTVQQRAWSSPIWYRP